MKQFCCSYLCTLEVGAVFPGEVSPEGGEGEHDRDVAHVARVLGGLLLLFLHTPGTSAVKRSIVITIIRDGRLQDTMLTNPPVPYDF